MNRPESIINNILRKFDELYPFSIIKGENCRCDTINDVIYENFVYQIIIHSINDESVEKDIKTIDISGRFNIFDDDIKNIEYTENIKK